MSKAIVIKGANFAANKVATITFSDIPCTGISFDEESYSVTELGNVDVGYTVTPSDTTDVVEFESSNSDIVQVVNGNLIAVGVGDCVITATCGSHSATANITVTVTYKPNWYFGLVGLNTANGYISVSGSYSNICTQGTGEQVADYNMYGPGPILIPAVKLPKNVGRVKVSCTNPGYFYSNAQTNLVWGKNESAGYSGAPSAIHAISREDAYNFRTEPTKEFTVPSGVDSFAFSSRLTTAGAEGDDPNAFAVAGGVAIEFLPVLD